MKDELTIAAHFFVRPLFPNPGQKGLHIGMRLEPVEGIEFLGEGVVGE
jgi:hypothetical protein